MRNIAIKQEAIKLRQQGLSLKEISKILGIAKSTASLWVNNISLSKEAKAILASKQTFGQKKAVQTKKQLQIEELIMMKQTAFDLIKTILCSFVVV